MAHSNLAAWHMVWFAPYVEQRLFGGDGAYASLEAQDVAAQILNRASYDGFTTKHPKGTLTPDEMKDLYERYYKP